MKSDLSMDCEHESNRITDFIRDQVSARKKEGVVIGLSGGVDSAVAAELSVRAVGKDRVRALILPDKESSPASLNFALKQAGKMGIHAEIIDITPALEGFRVYETRDRAIQEVIPEYAPGQKMKISLPPGLLDGRPFNIYTLSVHDDQGVVRSSRLHKDPLRAILAATNMKQRARMMRLYFLAERKNSLVCGTTNRTECRLGFFVKYGDGGVDIEPIAHLYKTQVYQLADHLGVIEEIKTRVPSPDTFTAEVSDEELYFRIPYGILDVLLYGWENKIPAAEVGLSLDLKEEQVRRAFRDFEIKYAIARHLAEMPPSLDLLSR